MTLPPAGWYEDPWAPSQMRYWNGSDWTAQTAPRSQSSSYSYGSAPAGRDTTPDGAPLSGWWRRVGARVLDQVIIYVIALPVTGYFWYQASQEFSTQFDRAVDAGREGRPAPSFEMTDDLSLALGVAGGVTLIVGIIYEVVLLRRSGATWGKRAAGIRVRAREHDGQLSWGTIGRRVGFIEALAVLSIIPVLGIAFSIAGLLNYLWPLWDSKRQAWHDKFAETNVVRMRA